jgi:hypothetical protein
MIDISHSVGDGDDLRGTHDPASEVVSPRPFKGPDSHAARGGKRSHTRSVSPCPPEEVIPREFVGTGTQRARTKITGRTGCASLPQDTRRRKRVSRRVGRLGTERARGCPMHGLAYEPSPQVKPVVLSPFGINVLSEVIRFSARLTHWPG